MIKSITVKDWDYTCGDGCCYEWGVYVTITNDKGDVEVVDAPNFETAIAKYFNLQIEYLYEDFL